MNKKTPLRLASVVVATIILASMSHAGDDQQKIAALEAKLEANPTAPFDFGLHNELRHLYSSVDEAKSMQHVEIILQHSPFNGYMRQVLGGSDGDFSKAKASLERWIKKYPGLPYLTSACCSWIGDLEPDRHVSEQYYRRAMAVRQISARHREVIEDRLLFDPRRRRTWPAAIAKPDGWQETPGPWSDPRDQTVWPNAVSRANSDLWLAEHHDEIREMRPRVLLINFSNEHSREHLDKLTTWLIDALAESTRYHGYRDHEAKPFLNYEIFRFVDLRDQDRIVGDSRQVPVKDLSARSGFNMKYRQYFTQEFGDLIAVPDPQDRLRNLRLDELIDGGYIHEVWFFTSGNTQVIPQAGAFEVVEMKPKYDERFQRIGNEFVQAGNGGDSEQPWTGRSCRIGNINASRGIGCFLESLAHGIEGNSNSNAVPYFTKYFREYAGFDLNEHYDVPFNSLYGVDYRSSRIRYPDPNTMVVQHGGKEYRINDYTVKGGNAHFPPNARGHYDLLNDQPVMSTIEDWRVGSGPDGQDIARQFTMENFRNYRDLAPDCMGPWLVYWRQNMPGFQSRQKDDDGKRMKNWWPFLFY